MKMKTERGREFFKDKLALLALLTALALVFSWVELLLPLSSAVPGVKLGLANLVILVALYTLGPGSALVVNVLRILLAGALYGNLFSVAYALSGGLLSLAVMILLKKTGLFSLAGVSMAGGVAHNAGQLLMAVLVVENPKLFLYLPILLFSGMVSGLLVGIAATLICRRLAHFKINSATL
ncbi:MAG: Gx transporter family protein [Bacillota bacterium]|nr:Gx transporter family protein [Bacillota bacterium]